MHAERTIYPGQQSRRGREEEAETAEAGARAGENSPNVFVEEFVGVSLTVCLSALNRRS